MNDWFRKYQFHNYRTAIAHLDQRSKRVRNDAPLAHAVRLVRHFVDDDSVSVIYHQTPIVTFWKNGTQALHWGGWYTKSTFQHMERYAKLGDLRMSAHNRTRQGNGEGVAWYLDRGDWPRTPSRITKCRKCKGVGTVEPHVAWEGDGMVNTRTCGHCNGNQGIERGRKIVPEIVEGMALLIHPGKGRFPQTITRHNPDDLPTYNCKCSLCRCGCKSWTSHWGHTQSVKQYTYTPSPAHSSKASTHYIGSEVADRLSELLPGLSELTNCPRCEGVRIQVRELIVHLNDSHRATREEIADWLDALDVDLRFPAPELAFS